MGSGVRGCSLEISETLLDYALLISLLISAFKVDEIPLPFSAEILQNLEHLAEAGL